MRVLERWDRHNQRIAEWHIHLGQEPDRRAARDGRWKATVFLALLLVLMRLTRRFLVEHIGYGWTMAIGIAVVVVLLWVALSGQRRRRLAWEASQQRTPVG